MFAWMVGQGLRWTWTDLGRWVKTLSLTILMYIVFNLHHFCSLGYSMCFSEVAWGPRNWIQMYFEKLSFWIFTKNCCWGRTAAPPLWLIIPEITSIGTGNIIVLLFSADILFRVWRYLSYKKNSSLKMIRLIWAHQFLARCVVVVRTRAWNVDA